MTDDDNTTLIRTLRDVLMEARLYVFAECEASLRDSDSRRTRNAAVMLERVDAAIVEADEVLT